MTEETGAFADPTIDPSPKRRAGAMRRLYDWVLHWAETPYGTPALAGLTLAESSFFPVPPDPLLMALCLGAARRAYWFATVATVSSVVGGVIGYWIGASAWAVVGDWFFAVVPGVTPEAFEHVQGFYGRWGFWAVFIAGFTFIPYKVITLSAGVFAIQFPVFFVASVLSRGLRFFIVAGLIHRFGEPIAAFIDRYFNLLSWVFVALIALGFVAVKFVL